MQGYKRVLYKKSQKVWKVLQCPFEHYWLSLHYLTCPQKLETYYTNKD